MNFDIESITSSALQHLPEPYFGTANLSLSFAVGGGGFAIDADTGNLVETTTNLIIQCSVSEDKQSRLDATPGNTGATVMYLRGRCLTPKILPVQITLSMTAIATLTNIDGSIISGLWRFTAIPQNRINAYVAARGSFVRGTIALATAV